jgi:hypothetical protein
MCTIADGDISHLESAPRNSEQLLLDVEAATMYRMSGLVSDIWSMYEDGTALLVGCYSILFNLRLTVIAFS